MTTLSADFVHMFEVENQKPQGIIIRPINEINSLFKYVF